ncbi:hypothetical protein [Streptomyces chartreusis]|uniref:hypothetical protein n=1 Tax=Streptomyces chartreusis TaxID=1969 RepID=UPI002E8212F2|nr:hypothetical protein [Streptomyces chartreusis]WUB17683.1 hypothetical protein OG997_13565 [Streptomyces chartreusis]
MAGPGDGFRLMRGSTGFFTSGDPDIRRTDPRACRTAWYAAARAAGGRVGEFEARQTAQTFHTATIERPDGRCVALFQAYTPLVAFVDEPHDWYTDQFREAPAWAAGLGDFGFTVLSAAVLLSPLSSADTSALSAVERRQIDYWRPEAVGAVLFNSWA